MSWILDDVDKFYLHHNETLLDGLIRIGKTAPFECRQGYCGSCKTKIQLINGKVSHVIAPICLLADNEVLACCCVVDGVIKIITCHDQ